jgi:hypothetical protein
MSREKERTELALKILECRRELRKPGDEKRARSLRDEMVRLEQMLLKLEERDS